ncbi:MAG: amidohydrolase family protein [Candidatus Pacebacteria bacterium]|nr:amidohydrolase family protein [Candidatus Paceibacterota bacterium]
MKPIDFHMHICPNPDTAKELNVASDSRLGDYLITLSQKVEASNLEKGLGIFLDTNLLAKENPLHIISGLKQSGKIDNLEFAAMIDFRSSQAKGQAKKAKEQGFLAIKFHPILQKMKDEDYEKAKDLAAEASSLGLIIIIDTHETGAKSYPYDSLRFANFILPSIKTPVILAHSGGIKTLEACVLALDFPNVYLETSFSIPFWLGSSIEQDLNFCFKKVGSNRIIFGSDFPYQDTEKSQKEAVSFFERHGFSQVDIENIMFKNALKLCQKK